MSTVWREGDRIRATEGMGYGDRVPDKNLAAYAASDRLHDVDRAFAEAVLAIRKFERISAAFNAGVAKRTAPAPEAG